VVGVGGVDSVGTGVGGWVGLVGDVGGGGVTVPTAVWDGSVGIVIESVSVDVAPGVGGFTPELGVEVGRGEVGSTAGELASKTLTPMKITREIATNRKTMAQALTARTVAVSCSSENMARLRSR
jgi:hypothetical protein